MRLDNVERSEEEPGRYLNIWQQIDVIGCYRRYIVLLLPRSMTHREFQGVGLNIESCHMFWHRMQAGRTIVLTSSAQEAAQTERATIAATAASADGSIIFLQRPLTFHHLGQLLASGGGPVDMRAVVLLLDRAVRIQGLDVGGKGAYISVGDGLAGNLQLSNVECHGCGQVCILDRNTTWTKTF